MSSLAYGAVTRKRVQAPANKSVTTSPPGLKTYVDTLAALVPAEVLAFHAFMVELTTKTTKKNGIAVTTITDRGTLEATFWVCIVLSMLLFLFTRLSGAGAAGWQRWDVARILVPPASFVLWTVVQKSTAFDAVSPDSLTEAMRAYWCRGRGRAWRGRRSPRHEGRQGQQARRYPSPYSGEGDETEATRPAMPSGTCSRGRPSSARTASASAGGTGRRTAGVAAHCRVHCSGSPGRW